MPRAGGEVIDAGRNDRWAKLGAADRCHVLRCLRSAHMTMSGPHGEHRKNVARRARQSVGARRQSVWVESGLIAGADAHGGGASGTPLRARPRPERAFAIVPTITVEPMGDGGSTLRQEPSGRGTRRSSSRSCTLIELELIAMPEDSGCRAVDRVLSAIMS